MGERRRRRRLGIGCVHAHDPPVGDDRGHAQPVPPLEPRLDRGLLLQAAHGSRAAADVLEGPHRHHRVRVGRGADPPAARAIRRGRAGGLRLPRPLRQGELLRRDHGPRARHRASDHGRPAAPGQAARPAARGHERPALHARARREEPRGAALRAVGVDPRRPEPVQVRRRRVLPEDRCRDAAPVPRPPRSVRQHAAHRRARERAVQHGRQLHAALPGPRGRERGELVRQGGRARPPRPLPRRHPRRRAQAGRLRGRRHHADGVPRLLPRGGRLHQLVEEQRHPGGPGSRIRCGFDGRLRDADHRPRPAAARADLRALPESRSRVDARLRRGLRRASPRRGHPVRHRQVRRRARRPDRHVRHDQGEAGAQGQLPRARLPVRHGREAHQGDAAGHHGQGHPPGGHPRHGPPPLQGGRRHPRPHRDGRRGQDGVRDRARPREPEAPVGRARRGRHHVERPAHRHHPDHEAGAGRPDRHAVRLPGVRVARPDQDGLPGAAQPHHHRRRARQHRGEPRFPPGARRPGPRRPARLRPAFTRRHARRVPARRRADARRCCGR